MSNKPHSRRRKTAKAKPRRAATSLSDHKRQGKLVRPPFMAMDNLKLDSWLTDRFPDYVWVCYLLAVDLDRGTKILNATLDQVNRTLDVVLGNTAEDRPVFDGSLSSWEAIPIEARAHVVDDLKAMAAWETAVPEEFAHLLGMYPAAPGAWLVTPWRDAGLSIDPVVAERAVNATIVACLSGRDPVPTRAKAMALRGITTAGLLHLTSEIPAVDLLPRYPNDLDDDELGQVESFIRATFGATSVLRDEADDGDGPSGAVQWAAQFWRANWSLYACLVAEPLGSTPDLQEIRAEAERFAELVGELWEQFEDAALKTDPDLYDPDRYEVLTGVAARCLRIVTAAIHSPQEWTAEHSNALIRSVMESLITLTWLAASDEPGVFAQFKAYGRGHLKLLLKHSEDHADTFDDVPEALEQRIEYLRGLVNEDLWEEFQDINVGGNFAGTDLRKMAATVGLETEYRLVLSPAANDFHGEWSHLDRYALTRCANPAHRFHRIPRQEVQPRFEPGIVEAAIATAARVIETYVAAITAGGA